MEKLSSKGTIFTVVVKVAGRTVTRELYHGTRRLDQDTWDCESPMAALEEAHEAIDHFEQNENELKNKVLDH